MRFIYHHRTRGRAVEGVHIRGVASGLRALGHEVLVVGPPGVSLEEEGERTGAPTWRSRVWDLFSRHCPEALFELAEVAYGFAGALRLGRACRRERAEAIYERYAFFNAAGMLAARARRIPFLLEVNDTVMVERERHGNPLLLRRLAGRIERRVFEGAAALFVVSEYLRDLLIRHGVPEEKIVVTPNAIDPERFDPARAAAAGVRESLGFEGKVVIGFVGSFVSWHGIELLMRVVPSLLERHPNAALLLVGDGSRRGPAEAEVAARGLADRVRFTGRIPHHRVPDYIGAMDIGLMPHSNRFGSPVKIFEYMAMGVAPVGPRFGPLEEAITDGETGILFEPESELSLQAALEGLIVDAKRRRNLGAAARERILSRHLWRQNAALIAERARFGVGCRVTSGQLGVRAEDSGAVPSFDAVRQSDRSDRSGGLPNPPDTQDSTANTQHPTPNTQPLAASPVPVGGGLRR